MPTDLNDLASRVEGAGSPDRELDAEIAAALRVCPDYAWANNYPAWQGRSDGRVYLEEGGPSFAAPRYTVSLDAAVALVPEAWGWLITHPNARAIASGLLKERTPVMGEVQNGIDHRFAVAAATPALALCAAALRARAALQGDS